MATVSNSRLVVLCFLAVINAVIDVAVAYLIYSPVYVCSHKTVALGADVVEQKCVNVSLPELVPQSWLLALPLLLSFVWPVCALLYGYVIACSGCCRRVMSESAEDRAVRLFAFPELYISLFLKLVVDIALATAVTNRVFDSVESFNLIVPLEWLALCAVAWSNIVGPIVAVMPVVACDMCVILCCQSKSASKAQNDASA